MMKRSLAMKVLASALILSLQAMFMPAIAAPEMAALSGTILSAQDQAPLTGVKLHAGDPRSGEIYSSLPTTADGSFAIDSLPAATYELAVEANGGLYLVDTPVKLSPGQSENLYVAVDFEKAASPAEAHKKKGGIWDNQLTAAFVVIAAAVVLGELIKQATNEEVQSPDSPED